MTAYVSALDLFSIGIGPSSSHTVGPMRAAQRFVAALSFDELERTERVTCRLYGSLGSTGVGHGTPDAVVAGLEGLAPETCDPAAVRGAWRDRELLVAGRKAVQFAASDIEFAPRTRLPRHPNAMTVTAFDRAGETISTETYFSIGGGFVVRENESNAAPLPEGLPHSFRNAAELLELCERENLTFSNVARDNEASIHGEDEAIAGIDAIWAAMAACVDAGLHTEGVLPGGLNVKRRASALRQRLEKMDENPERDTTIEWLHAFALAVNEENAAGGKVVTAPTNGAAGIIPAVGMYALRFVPEVDELAMRRYLLTATVIGSLFKTNASISGAEAGCQGEVGSACAMAAGALCAVLGGTPRQVENAAEIAMEHHLGLTCDPVAGLVQVPCIERNAIASSTAVSAARMAIHGDGTHLVSLDTVIETMRQTGEDMSFKYKETSEGGLAVNVVEC